MFAEYVLFVLCSSWAYGDQRTVLTSVGSITGFSGFSNFDGRGNGTKVWKYLGIPYAKPPIGERRFRKPVPMSNFKTVFNALNFGPACPQDNKMASMWIPGENNYSEDCLTLNIFVPEVTSSSASKLPVMFWIHGGAYIIGQSGIYSGENLAAFGDVIVITINYRLGSLGFLATHDDDTKGNYGLWDQHLALQWIHNNIDSFGGNPTEVTLFGESAGAASAVYQAMYPGNRGLMKRIIVQSGSANSAWAFQSRDKSARYTRVIGKSLGCPDLTNTAAIVRCLRGKSFQEIIDHSRVGTPKETLFRTEFAPVIDNEIVFIDALAAFVPERAMPRKVRDWFSEIDVITGINKGDGGFITSASLLPYIQNINKSFPSKNPGEILEETVMPLLLADRLGNTSATLNKVAAFLYKDWNQPPNQNTTFLHELLDISSDHFFFIPSLFTARTHSEITNSASTYLFQFSHHSSYIETSDWIEGAQHGEEIPYVFGFPAGTLKTAMKYPDHVTATQRMLSTNMMTYWTNFAKTGNPNLPISVVDGPVWSKYDLDHQHYIDFDTNITINSRMYATREAFWLHLARELQDTVISSGTSTNVFPPFPGIIIG
ncbi:neuroligin-4, X-linked-like [Ylistrum balloti]|uniref:neuroligin-4, X-linked-like n=1 Tax=Ylistrum balloti TaxID=509963 RepID=UPI0029057E07|nr:neuroligin-4, X-linked-like [Ylistrum balloti]